MQSLGAPSKKPFVILSIAWAAGLIVVVVVAALWSHAREFSEVATWPAWKVIVWTGVLALATIIVAAVLFWRECNAQMESHAERHREQLQRYGKKVADLWLRRAQKRAELLRIALLKKNQGWNEQEMSEHFHGWRAIATDTLHTLFGESIANTLDGAMLPSNAPQHSPMNVLLVAMIDDRVKNLDDIVKRFHEGSLTLGTGLGAAVFTPPASGTALPPNAGA